MRIRQSDLGAAQRCFFQKKLFDEQEAGTGKRGETNSATVLGTVIHYAAMILEQLHHEGREDACEVAVATFENYWAPQNLTDLEPMGIGFWLPRQTWGGLRIRGRKALRDYYDLLRKDDGKLLGLEYQWEVPYEIDGETHQLHGTADRLALRLYKGEPYLSVEDFKGLSLDTPLPTPTGWTTMGQVQVGDYLLGADGMPCTVTAKSGLHERPCYRVRFDDGSSIVADNVHLWQVHTDDGVQVLDTDGLRARLNSGRRQRDLRIPNAEPLQLPERQLPIDPYVMGAWLGDGTRQRGVISKPEEELFAAIAERGYQVGKRQQDGASMTRTIFGLRSQLKELGLLDGDKYLPRQYLRGSYQQRLDLLRGLMDTDGSWHRKRRRAVFTTCDKQLAHDVHELVATLGWRPSLFEVQRTGFDKRVTAYDVTFVPMRDNCFQLSRKAELVDTLDGYRGVRAGRRMVVSVERTATVTTACVQVDSPDSLYLAGEQMVPTHNTGKRPYHLRYLTQWTVYSYASTRPEFWTTFGELIDPVVAALRSKRRKHQYALWDDGSGLPMIPRRGRWINLSQDNVVSLHDVGWRTNHDYARMHIQLREYVNAHKANVFPLTLSGETCHYCFSGETEVWTDQGVKPFKELAGTTARLLVNTGGGGVWTEAPIRSYGQSKLLTVHLRRGKSRHTIRATPSHDWFVRVRTDEARTESRLVPTADLQPGQRLLTMRPRPRTGKVEISPVGVMAGVVYGDGTKGRTSGTVVLHGDKRELARYFTGHPQTDRAETIEINGLPRFMKQAPDLEESASYLLGWLAGVVATDGDVNKQQVVISSASEESIRLIQTVAARAGLASYGIRVRHRTGYGEEPTPLYALQLAAADLPDGFLLREAHRQKFVRPEQHRLTWTVEAVTDDGEAEEVFCAEVDEHENFALDGFIQVHNCPFSRNGACGGVPIPELDEGSP